MKIAALSDIHGNHVALDAVLSEASKLGVERLFILGDLVGYYYHPKKILELLENWETDIIQGNHEAMLKDALEDKNKAEKIKKKYGHGINTALNQLSKEEIETLISLPESKKITIGDVDFLLCHGSPWDRDEYIYPDAKEEKLNRCADPNMDFVIIGHSHHPFIHKHNKTTIINAGSVGQARDKGSIASWVIIDTSNNEAIIKHTSYDVSSVIEDVNKNDPDLLYLKEVLTR